MWMGDNVEWFCKFVAEIPNGVMLIRAYCDFRGRRYHLAAVDGWGGSRIAEQPGGFGALVVCRGCYVVMSIVGGCSACF